MTDKFQTQWIFNCLDKICTSKSYIMCQSFYSLYLFQTYSDEITYSVHKGPSPMLFPHMYISHAMA
jgi:hypothetical protein